MGAMPQTLLIGLGQDFRRDDAVGLLAVRRLRALGLPAEMVEAPAADGAALLDRWAGYQTVALIDAVRSGAPPGTVHSIDIRKQGPPAESASCSTHLFGLAKGIALAEVLGRMPEKLLFYGVEVGAVRQGEGLSRKAQEGLDRLLAILMADLFSGTKADGAPCHA
jgi:hydrogenase maturation protease